MGMASESKETVWDQLGGTGWCLAQNDLQEVGGELGVGAGRVWSCREINKK